eukprot:4794932-Prymnesium_polylepis.1
MCMAVLISVTRGVSWGVEISELIILTNFHPTTRCTRTRRAEAHCGVGRTHPTQALSSYRSNSIPRSRPNRWAALLRTFRAEDLSTATRQRSVCASYGPKPRRYTVSAVSLLYRCCIAA